MIERELFDLDQSPRRGRIDLLGLPVDPQGLRIPDDLDCAAAQNRAFLATFLNPYSCYLASENSGFARTLDNFDHISCDGIGLVMAAKMCAGRSIPRQAFDTTSIALPVLDWAVVNKKPLILVGGKPGVAKSAAKILTQLIPNLTLAGTYWGFEEGPDRAMEHAKRLGDSVVLCGMGAPLQEEFLVSLKKCHWQGLGFTCGGFFDQLIERVDYYPAWINRMNLRFVYRLYKEPHRLRRRYLIEYQVFIGRFFKALVAR